MNCIIIEDDKVQQQIIRRYIHKTDNLDCVATYNNPLDFFKTPKILNIGIIFLDVEMPEMSGIEFLKKIDLPYLTSVVLITSHKNYALEAYENNVVDYLLKPCSYAQFLKSIAKVSKINPIHIKKDFIFIRSNGADVKLFFDEILRIEGASEYIVIITKKKNYMVYSSMKSIIEKLPDDFIRVHRSNIVSISKIEKIHGHIIEINGDLVKISRTYKSIVESIIN
tara:strand:+ start:1101 stop:1772 length:672 start_codon:yes stop_codon:yes gene_type:complete